MFDHRYPTRVVNVRYTVNGLHFDAAIDCNWQLHAYSESPDVMKKRVPIELYVLTTPNGILECYIKISLMINLWDLTENII